MTFRRAIIMLVAAVLLLSATTVTAGGPRQPAMRANVPFAFRVGDNLMPPGEYRIAHFNPPNWLLITSIDNKACLIINSVPSGKESGIAARLVFRRYGATYFLRQVLIPTTDAKEFVPSKAEQEYVSRGGGGEHLTVVGFMEK